MNAKMQLSQGAKDTLWLADAATTVAFIRWFVQPVALVKTATDMPGMQLGPIGNAGAAGSGVAAAKSVAL
ncbi:hypothetical protein CDL15_Pgr017852 [Punica granatum]|uniref:Uncharacterized protein n=1 Tax=Punica granatum TaxID=22663 RepID=A0A218WHL7_PUNGR|nr:hypothetical protein CDL15_Pgr017852 [Punica granatum]